MSEHDHWNLRIDDREIKNVNDTCPEDPRLQGFLERVVLTGDDFPQVSPVRPAETLWLSLLGVSRGREGDDTGIYWMQARGNAKHPPVPRTALQQQNLAPDVSDAEVERPWSQVRLKDECSSGGDRQFWGRHFFCIQGKELF